MAEGWQFWIDRGGTFTDVVARAPDGALHVDKAALRGPAAATPTRRWRRSGDAWALPPWRTDPT